MDYLTIDHINSQSLLANLDEIKMLMSDKKTDILCVSETWLSPYIPDIYVNIPNYKVFRCDGGQAAGVCLYVMVAELQGYVSM